MSRRRIGIAAAATLLTACAVKVWADAESAPAAQQRAPVFSKGVPETLDDLLAIETQVQRLTERLIACTVNVQIGPAQGSGVIVSRDGYVLTAAHVIGQPGRTVNLTLADGRVVKGKSLGVDHTRDAGLVKISTEGDWPFAEMAPDDSFDTGDWCLVLGHPGGYQPGRGAVLRLGRIVHKRRTLVQTDCTLVGGDSGGPLFDMQGRVIGIHSRIGASTTWNFHVPISAYSQNWDRLVAAESWGGPPERGGAFLGVGGEDHEQGCRVAEVTPNFPADKAGLKVGDIIVQFDKTDIRDFSDLLDAVRRRKPGDRVTIVILRGAQRLEKTVELVPRP